MQCGIWCTGRSSTCLEAAKVGEDGQHAGELCEALRLHSRRDHRDALRPLPLGRRLDCCRNAIASLLQQQRRNTQHAAEDKPSVMPRLPRQSAAAAQAAFRL